MPIFRSADSFGDLAVLGWATPALTRPAGPP